ncbi:MAG: methyltransferase [Polyangiaceae bacterium]
MTMQAESLVFHTTDDTKLKGNPIDDVIGASIKYAAIVSAAKLGLIQALQDRPLAVAELATAIGASVQGTQVLADVLVSIGYLSRRAGQYSHGPIAERWLNGRAPQDFTPALLWGYELWNVLWELPQAIRDGKPRQSLWERWADRPEAGRDFSDYMKVKSTLTVSSIVEAAPVPKQARRLLDLGGSHGLHTIAFCQRYPQLSATLMDLPEALANTSDSIRQAGVEQRVTLRKGNFLVDPLGDGYDVILLFEILHNHTPQENQALLVRAARALNPGGVVLVLEDLKSDDGETHNAAFSLAMFACSGDRTYSAAEIGGWFEAGGLLRRDTLKLPSSVSLMVGEKP